MSAPTWNDEFDLRGGSQPISEFQYYFQYIIKKHQTISHNFPLQCYVNNIKNSIALK